VQAVYPGLVVTFERGGITIHPCTPAIAPRPAKRG
jgi:hypothetical protein